MQQTTIEVCKLTWYLHAHVCFSSSSARRYFQGRSQDFLTGGIKTTPKNTPPKMPACFPFRTELTTGGGVQIEKFSLSRLTPPLDNMSKIGSKSHIFTTQLNTFFLFGSIIPIAPSFAFTRLACMKKFSCSLLTGGVNSHFSLLYHYKFLSFFPDGGDILP